MFVERLKKGLCKPLTAKTGDSAFVRSTGTEQFSSFTPDPRFLE
jgi:hypothetical protein